MDRPGISKCRPDRGETSQHVGQWFRAWCVERRISARDLAAILDITSSRAARKLSGELPVSLADIRRFPPRYRGEFVLAFVSWCSATDNNLLAHG